MLRLLTKITVMLALTICIIGSASAQVRNSGGNGIVGVGLYTGIESASGTCEMSIALCYDNTFVLNSFGEWETHHLTVSLNYFNSLPSGGNGFAVTGGTWSLVVVRDNQYAGTLYGEIKDGSITYPPTEEEISKKITTLNLESNGGLGIFQDKRRKKINGVLKITTDLNSRKTDGRLDWNFS